MRILRGLLLFKLAGGVAINAPVPADDAAPTLHLDGFTAFGGVAVGAKPAES